MCPLFLSLPPSVFLSFSFSLQGTPGLPGQAGFPVSLTTVHFFHICHANVFTLQDPVFS